jgi:hypothetical protein
MIRMQMGMRDICETELLFLNKIKNGLHRSAINGQRRMLSKDDITEIIGRIRELLKIHGSPGNRIHNIAEGSLAEFGQG